MRWPVKLLAVLIFAAIVALAVIRFAPPRATDVTPAAPVQSRTNLLLSRADADPSRNTRGRDFLKRVYARGRGPEPVSSATDINTAGMLKVGEILESTESDVAKAQKLLALSPALPDDEKMEAAEHAANLVTDRDYDVLKSALINPDTPGPVLDELLADLLRRGNSLKLPTLVDIARQPDHPRSVEARDLLELHIGEDHDTNWIAWVDAVRRHIAEHGE
jgi:hypothetical protein